MPRTTLSLMFSLLALPHGSIASDHGFDGFWSDGGSIALNIAIAENEKNGGAGDMLYCVNAPGASVICSARIETRKAELKTGPLRCHRAECLTRKDIPTCAGSPATIIPAMRFRLTQTGTMLQSRSRSCPEDQTDCREETVFMRMEKDPDRSGFSFCSPGVAASE
ncbi:MAG: hypothetical protein IJ523_03110 [Succinivibrionaceae bacterium]|nr:hypothetical protein [Succinivibrionaceae bacterium]